MTNNGRKLLEAREKFSQEKQSIILSMISNGKRLPREGVPTLTEESVIKSRLNFGTGRLNKDKELSPLFEVNAHGYVSVANVEETLSV